MTYFSRLQLAQLACALFLLLTSLPAGACLNDAEHGSDRGASPAAGRSAETSQMLDLLYPEQFSLASHLETINRFKELLKNNPEAARDLDQRNSYGLALVYTGHPQEARDVWAAMEAEHPGEYRTAANLGTAYELCGDNENALKWITEGLKRNPDSHSGTEWLHARILEAKLALAKDPAWLEKNHASGLAVSTSHGLPVGYRSVAIDNTGVSVQLEDMRRALRYQLKERLKFLRDPDPMVAQLLVDLGDSEMLSGSAHTAALVYKRAIEYGAKPGELAAREEAARQSLISPLQRLWPLLVLAALLLFAGLTFVVLRRRMPSTPGASKLVDP